MHTHRNEEQQVVNSTVYSGRLHKRDDTGNKNTFPGKVHTWLGASFFFPGGLARRPVGHLNGQKKLVARWVIKQVIQLNIYVQGLSVTKTANL